MNVGTQSISMREDQQGSRAILSHPRTRPLNLSPRPDPCSQVPAAPSRLLQKPQVLWQLPRVVAFEIPCVLGVSPQTSSSSSHGLLVLVRRLQNPGPERPMYCYLNCLPHLHPPRHQAYVLPCQLMT